MENIENTKNMPTINADEFSVAETEAEKAKEEAQEGGFSYTHLFSKPFTYMKVTYTELRFDWDSLIGRDAIEIENELQALRIAVVAPALSGPFLLRMAARACTEKIGADAFELMPLHDYNRIRNAARSFLLASE